MRVFLISANREEINMPTWPFGLACVTAATQRAGHTAKLLDLMTVKDPPSVIKESIDEFDPDIIGVSVRNIDDQNMENPRFLLDPIKEVISLCRSLSNAPIILGGAGYSIFPESALAYLGADMGIQGEGEIVFPALIEQIEKGANLAGLAGLYLPGRGLQGARIFSRDLDPLPLPDAQALYHSLPEVQEFWLPFHTRRGCPMDCYYCSTPTIEGRLFRNRSPDMVIKELCRWAEAGFNRLFFVDNTFNLPPSYAKALCSSLAEADVDIGWRSIIYPLGMDETLVKQMAKAGCKEVSIGFESGCERILRRLNKRFKTEDVRLTCEMFADNGIRQMGFLLLGGPGETKESVQESLAFADSLSIDALKITVGIRIYPDTALAKLAVDEGVVAPHDDLLLPRFYMVRGLEDWLQQTVRSWMAERPHWLT